MKSSCIYGFIVVKGLRINVFYILHCPIIFSGNFILFEHYEPVGGGGSRSTHFTGVSSSVSSLRTPAGLLKDNPISKADFTLPRYCFQGDCEMVGREVSISYCFFRHFVPYTMIEPFLKIKLKIKVDLSSFKMKSYIFVIVINWCSSRFLIMIYEIFIRYI